MKRALVPALAASVLAACAGAPRAPARADYHGTLEPFASNAIYFVVTDRFVNGDPTNDHRDQGGAHPTWDLPIACPDGVVAHLGYMGGDFRGLLDNADYIRGMGFGAVWITPIVDNPDEAFTGGDPVSCDSILTDRGKAGYHGYWGMNFHRVDEHLASAGLGFAELARGLRAKGLATVLDIVGNHGSPAFTMPVAQPGFGQVFDASGRLVADHANTPPERLDPVHHPLQRFYNTRRDIAQLGDFNPDEPAVLDHLVGAYLQWIDAGAAALRIDTISHQPLRFWKAFAGRIRAAHPGFYMFGEAFDYDAAKIAPYTWNANGRYGVLDFPQKQALVRVFGREQAGFETLARPLALERGPYQNPYELVTFYDNHDMARLDADDTGFIDAHDWLFTARGIPVVYYGSEIGFMRGRAEHHGNRNYFGSEGIAVARAHPIHARLARIARARAASPALQRGLQLDLELRGDRAAFYRVIEHAADVQVALVLINKGDTPARFDLGRDLQPGHWRSAFENDAATFDARADEAHPFEVAPHDVSVWLLDAPVTLPRLKARLDRLQRFSERRTSGG